MKFLLGGKGANLGEMCNIGLSVPPGFTITTEVCDFYCKAGNRLPPEVIKAANMALQVVQKETGKVFGDPAKPLLLSVRSGAAISMPGMMDTILNLGLNDVTVKGLAANFGERFALVIWSLDSFTLFIPDSLQKN